MSAAILIVTHSQDLTADFVIRHLVGKYRFVRLDADTLSTPKRHFGFENGRPLLHYDDIVVAAEDVSAIWARRFAKPRSLEQTDPYYRQFAQRELRDTTEAFLDSVDGIVVNSYEADRLAGNRLIQSMRAVKVGFAVPETFVTQDAARASLFASRKPAIMKAISFGVLNEERDRVVHTTTVEGSSFEDMESCPVLVQERIAKLHEWRVTTVGDKTFAARTRQDVDVDSTDWRKSANVKNIFEPATLPEEVETRLLRLCALSVIHFGAHDLIETADGDFVFLETNPAGQWAWLELTLGLPIGQAIAQLLISGGSGASAAF